MTTGPLLQSLQQTQCWSLLQKLDPTLADAVIIFVEEISPLLDTIVDHFPNYTNHDAIHSIQIVKRYHQILKPECFEPHSVCCLSATELYLLICSAFAHDLGMTVFPGEEEALCSQLNINRTCDWKQNSVLQDYLRCNHSTRGYKYLIMRFMELRIPRHLLSFLNALMVAHNQSTEQLKIAGTRTYAADQTLIEIAQLSSILCVADAIEFSDTRVKEEVISRLSEREEGQLTDAEHRSLQENLKHSCINSNLAVDHHGIIIVSGTFSDSDVLNLAHHTLDDIELWIRGYLEIDSRATHPRLKVKAQIIRTLEIPQAQFERLGIRMRKENIIRLITSNSVWQQRSAIPIKELLQNAVEACRYRMHNSTAADQYEPKITVRFDKPLRTIIVEDNGCGMSRHTILEHFLTVGNSRSFDPTYNRGAYTSLARFGIGFWSVFTIAKEATITTKDFHSTDSALSFVVSIEKMKDYVLFNESQPRDGTIIELKLKDDISVDDIIGKVKQEIICSEVPTELIVGDSCLLIPQEIELPNEEEIFGAWKEAANQAGIQTFRYSKKDNDYSFALYINYVIKEGKPSFFLKNGEPVSKYKNHVPGYSTVASVLGFGVNNGFSNGVFTTYIGQCVANIRNPSGIQFTLNRLGLINTPQYQKFQTELCHFRHEAYYKWLQLNNSLSPEDVYRLNMESRKLVQGDIATPPSWLHNFALQFPDLVTYKLYKIDSRKQLNNADVIFHNHSTLCQLDEQILTYGTFYSPASNFHINERNADLVYELVKQIPSLQGKYFHEPTMEVHALFTMDPDGYIHNQIVPIQDRQLLLPVFVLNPTRVHSGSVDQVLTNFHGKWSGSVIIRRVEGNTYSLTEGRLFLSPNSSLTALFKDLASKGDSLKMAEIAHNLKLAAGGIVHDDIRPYIK